MIRPMSEMRSPVSFIRTPPHRDGVLASVSKAMQLASWYDAVSGNSVFIKINTMSFPLVPGTNTSPWVLEGVLKELRSRLPDISIAMGDAEIVGVQNVEKAGRIWGYERLANKYDVPFVNLSKEPLEEVGAIPEILPGNGWVVAKERALEHREQVYLIL